MEKIQDLINYMYLIIPIGCAFKCTAILVQQFSEENKEPFKKKFKNVLTFFVLSMTAAGLIDVLFTYIGKPN